MLASVTGVLFAANDYLSGRSFLAIRANGLVDSVLISGIYLDRSNIIFV